MNHLLNLKKSFQKSLPFNGVRVVRRPGAGDPVWCFSTFVGAGASGKSIYDLYPYLTCKLHRFFQIMFILPALFFIRVKRVS